MRQGESDLSAAVGLCHRAEVNRAEAQERAKHGRRHHVCTWRSRLVRARGVDVGGSGGAKDRLAASAQPPLSLPGRSLVQGQVCFVGGDVSGGRQHSAGACQRTPWHRGAWSEGHRRGGAASGSSRRLCWHQLRSSSPRCRRETIRRRWRTRWRRGMRGRGASRRRGCRTRRARCHTGTTSPRRRTSRCAPCPLAQPRGLLSAISGWR